MGPVTGGRPVTTWAAASERLGGPLRDLTVRNVVRAGVGGIGLRVRLTNAFGDREVTFGRVYVGVSRAGAVLEPGSNRLVTFGGSPQVTVAPGATALSDPLSPEVASPSDPVAVRAGQRLAVSVYVRGEADTLTGRNRATVPSPAGGEPAVSPAYRSIAGDHAADEGGAAYTGERAVWHWLDALTVVTAEPVPVVAALGDSLTTGVGSETGNGWADLLAHRLDLAVLNEGVSGGKVLAAGTGRPAEERLSAEVLTKPGIGTVILQAGLNDLGAGARAGDLVAAYRRMAATAHAAGVRMIGGTITPYAGAEYHTAEGERARLAVNAFIREKGVFDGVADFDAALRDPAEPCRLLPAYDCGDHLHPSAAGHLAMAAALDPRSMWRDQPASL
ncbi:SGNH/GDSL hydrolase family protein [Nonomuraea sp. PA05]|uniref:GDSL-type esterase/lipase family protein n=1 Tax=Nonomuraea sp. PA05 TaxID=2604466 RepID=UPI0011D31458|nr:GDSL-type esterase/lipase family protein [Nonomuraea sp. PA05]TYB52378.1 SGNH/GDSL hydrolase family protein [Nonomuraea sp. PA05]